MALSPRCYHLLKFIIPISFLIIATSFYLSSYSYLPIPNKGWGAHSDASSKESGKGGIDGDVVTGISNAGLAGKKVAFIQAAADWEIDGAAWDQRPLRGVCAGTKWRAGLIFQCHPSYGGIGNVRNTVLTCLRYAIEAGATSLILPQITARDAGLIDLKHGKNLPFTYMFDQNYFIDMLASTCPQIHIIPHVDDLADIPSVAKPAELTPKNLGSDFKVFRVMNFAPQWRGLFEAWLPKFAAPKGFSAEKPLLVAITPAIFEFPNNYDQPDFIATYGRILRFHTDVRRLAGIVLYALDKKYGLAINPSQTGIPAAEKFYGAHLRTAVDATKAGFAPYADQANAYLADAAKHKLSVIYLASGSAPDIERFTSDAAAHNVSVTTKVALLAAEPEFANALLEVQALSWDQQAEIDYLLLLRSSAFGGTWASSFAWNIAFRRHVVVNGGRWVHSHAALSARGDDGVVSRDEPGKACYQDRINTIFGADERGIWFELSMWP